ncbi:tyrosinase family oxidase copper chaperone [Streptomyces sp. NPDC050433]|uniref:tyrosinase family oxidase copper chaperone n=1 Tax=unclassified Streptomyces TaxID=2593676 RepID=UPI00341FC1FA
MAGDTQLKARPAEAWSVEPVALVPRQSHPPHEPPAAPTSRPGRTRRLFLRVAFALGVTGATAAALTPILRSDPRKADPGDARAPAVEHFDEMYGGRHIQGVDAGIRIDGRPLHVMRRADGSYVSVVNHFESFPTALATARAAVDDLAGTQLALAGPAVH